VKKDHLVVWRLGLLKQYKKRSFVRTSDEAKINTGIESVQAGTCREQHVVADSDFSLSLLLECPQIAPVADERTALSERFDR
jgi:hypothetical protein